MRSEKTARNGVYVDEEVVDMLGVIHGKDKQVDWLAIGENWYHRYEGGHAILRPTSKYTLPEEYLL